MRPIALTLLAIAAAAASAQSRMQSPTGTVSGHVFCADTNEPARFASVSLIAVSVSSTNGSQEGTPPDSFATSLDGSFTITKVKPGAYYVVVSKLGYINPHENFTADQILHPTADIKSVIADSMPIVVVEPNRTESAEVRLQHGASITGTILYDDGSPAGELSVNLLQKDATGKWTPVHHTLKHTDEHGTFHIASLLPGDYIIKADLELSDSKTVMQNLGNVQLQTDLFTSRSSLSFYNRGTAHLAEAKPITVPNGQELSGQDMLIPIAKLHKLSGRIAAGKDGHFINSAKLSLVNRDDGTEIASTELAHEDGVFHFEFIPDGDYILKITEAADAVWETPKPTSTVLFPQEKERIITAYGNSEQPVLFSGDQLDFLATIDPSVAIPNPTTVPSTIKAVDAQSNPIPDSTTTPQPQAQPAPQAAPQLAPHTTPEAKSNVASLGDL